MRFAVILGSYHSWKKSKIVHIADSYDEAESWIKEHIKMGQHMYIDKVQKVRLK